MKQFSTGKLIKSSSGYTQVFMPDEIQDGKGLPDDMIAAFKATGNAQRFNEGCPESVMRRAQRYFGGGVLTNLMEHVGDLTHRLTHHIEYGEVYPSLVREKVDRAIRSLSRGQDFVDEHESNLINNAEYQGIDENDMRENMARYLSDYADAHESVPVYNRIQWYAREAAIQLGRERFDKSLSALEVLDGELENLHTFIMRATMVNRDDAGEVAVFEEKDFRISLACDSEYSNAM